MDIITKEFFFWKNRSALLKTANLDNPQVRMSMYRINYENYCSKVQNTVIHDESMKTLIKFIKGVKDKDKNKAHDAIIKGVGDWKNKLSDKDKLKVKMEEL